MQLSTALMEALLCTTQVKFKVLRSFCGMLAFCVQQPFPCLGQLVPSSLNSSQAKLHLVPWSLLCPPPPGSGFLCP